MSEFVSFPSRYYKSRNGKKASEWIFSQATEVSKNSNVTITVSKFRHPWQQFRYGKTLNFSVIARFEAKPELLKVQKSEPEPELPLIIIGAHIDSINQFNPWFGKAPGADDDGSGTTSTFEVFRILAENGFSPKRPVEFHWYSAEEGGLLGSQKVAEDYIRRGIPVLSMYQVDMTGFVPKLKKPIIGVATDNISPTLGAFVKKLVQEYCSIEAMDVQCG
jgi:leucyl aminopeptidase